MSVGQDIYIRPIDVRPLTAEEHILLGEGIVFFAHMTLKEFKEKYPEPTDTK